MPNVPLMKIYVRAPCTKRCNALYSCCIVLYSFCIVLYSFLHCFVFFLYCFIFFFALVFFFPLDVISMSSIAFIMFVIIFATSWSYRRLRHHYSRSHRHHRRCRHQHYQYQRHRCNHHHHRRHRRHHHRHLVISHHLWSFQIFIPKSFSDILKITKETEKDFH